MKKKGWKIISVIIISLVLVLTSVCIWQIIKINWQAEEIEIFQSQKEFLTKLIFSEEVPYLGTWEKYGEEVLTNMTDGSYRETEHRKEPLWYDGSWDMDPHLGDVEGDRVIDYWVVRAIHREMAALVMNFYEIAKDTKPSLKFVLIAFPWPEFSSGGYRIDYYWRDRATGKAGVNSIVERFEKNYLIKAWEKSEEGWRVVLQPTTVKRVRTTVLKENRELKFELD